MPFEALETFTKDNMPPQATISYERFKRKAKPGSAKGKPRLLIYIPTTLAGLTRAERFSFDLGTGADHGKARITGLKKGAVGGQKGSMLEHMLRINFGYVPAFGDDADTSAAGEKVNVRKIDVDCWEIDLPAWFKVEPKSARKSNAHQAT